MLSETFENQVCVCVCVCVCVLDSNLLTARVCVAQDAWQVGQPYTAWRALILVGQHGENQAAHRPGYVCVCCMLCVYDVCVCV